MRTRLTISVTRNSCRILDKELSVSAPQPAHQLYTRDTERRDGQRGRLHKPPEEYQVREIFFGKSATLFVLCREQAWDEDGPKIDNVAQRLNYRVISLIPFESFSVVCEYNFGSEYFFLLITARSVN